MPKKKSFAIHKKLFKNTRLLTITVIAFIALIGGWFIVSPQLFTPAGINVIKTTDSSLYIRQPVGCTRDLFICNDGSRVWRTGSNCEFVCPKPTPYPTTTSTSYPLPSMTAYPSASASSYQSPIPSPLFSSYPSPYALASPTPPSSSPTPTPTPQTGYITSFLASKPCGTDSFQEYSYTCKNGIKNSISICQTIQNAMTQVLKVCSSQVKGI